MWGDNNAEGSPLYKPFSRLQPGDDACRPVSLTSHRNWAYLLGAYKMLAGLQSLFHLVSGPSRWYLNNNDATTYLSRDFGESPFDRIFIPADRREFTYSRQYVLSFVRPDPR